MQSNPCKDMCDNKSFMKAMKMRITLDGLEFAACAFALLKQLKSVDLPTFGSPTMPHFSAIVSLKMGANIV
jgi:hypothetical protein